MSSSSLLKRRILLILRQLDGQPLEQDDMVDAVSVRFVPRPTRGDVEEAIKDLEEGTYIHGSKVDLQGVVYTLSAKGQLAAQQLR